MWRRRPSQSESLPASNPAYAYPFSNPQGSAQMSRRGPIEGPYGNRLTRRVTWRSSTYKLVAYLYVMGVLYIVWLIRDLFFLPFSSSSTPSAGANLPATHDYLAQFKGRQECGISSLSLYNPPSVNDHEELRDAYCQNRTSLLDALSNGGRLGFDAPYTPRGCHYRWYTTEEICNVLRRFDSVIFVGDGSLANIYAGFNILLRQDLAHGSLKQWEMSNERLEACKCEKQFSRDYCPLYQLRSSEEVYSMGRAAKENAYACSSHVSHTFLSISGSPAPSGTKEKFEQLLKSTKGKKPIPVIHSLTLPAALSQQSAIASLDEWLRLARVSGRKVPFLWVGPTDVKDPAFLETQGNGAIARYTLDMIEPVRRRGVDALGMYNLTLQATTWDGSHYGEKTSLVQAMMLINWLAFLDD
ncbi:hypothetical protein VTN77DRAFT_748 [Rasamsonia byssochlamydoides]|uniref:uncharacterized protein n=1 Tax=Rasamsonia byssochlamydoides TaxID=89139 RepID=UPI0037448738